MAVFYLPYVLGWSIKCTDISAQFNQQQNIFPCNKMAIFGHYVILFIFLSFTRVQLEFNLHLTGDPWSTEIDDDNSPNH